MGWRRLPVAAIVLGALAAQTPADAQLSLPPGGISLVNEDRFENYSFSWGSARELKLGDIEIQLPTRR